MRTTPIEEAIDVGILTKAVPPATSARVHLEAGTPMPQCTDPTALKGYFISRDGTTFAGSHLIIDLRKAKRLDDVVFIEETLIEAATAAGATLLHTHCHHFTGGGVSGVAVL